MTIRDFFLALGLPVTGYPKPSPEPKGVQRLPVPTHYVGWRRLEPGTGEMAWHMAEHESLPLGFYVQHTCDRVYDICDGLDQYFTDCLTKYEGADR